MKPSVTVLLPIHNAQHRLENQVAEILDVLPELTHRFELLIIDDGSTDDSFDVARHLSLKYPQVSALRHPSRLGLANAVNSGLEQTEGDLVLVGDEQHGVRADDLRRLWHSYTEQPAAEERDDEEQSLAVAHVGRPGALVRKDARLEAQSPADAGRDSGARSCPVERVGHGDRDCPRHQAAAGRPRERARPVEPWFIHFTSSSDAVWLISRRQGCGGPWLGQSWPGRPSADKLAHGLTQRLWLGVNQLVLCRRVSIVERWAKGPRQANFPRLAKLFHRPALD